MATMAMVPQLLCCVPHLYDPPEIDVKVQSRGLTHYSMAVTKLDKNYCLVFTAMLQQFQKLRPCYFFVSLRLMFQFRLESLYLGCVVFVHKRFNRISGNVEAAATPQS